MWVDSHCHLDYPELTADLPGVLARAKNAGVNHMLTICVELAKFPQVLAVAEQHPHIFCTVGTHPHEAQNEVHVKAADILGLIDHPKVVGIGECGLDYYYDHSPHAEQQAVFREHIHAAQESGLPLIIHARDADEDMAHILKEEMARKNFKAVFHCFSSTPDLAQIGVDLGFFISFSGILTFKNAESVREAAKLVPLDRLLVETDSPYLAPIPFRGKSNEPAYTVFTAEKLAEVKGVTVQELARVTTDNFFRLFDKAIPVDR